VLETELKSVGIDIPSWRVLLILGEKSQLSVGAISEAAIINLSTMMRIVQRMTRAGLVSCQSLEHDMRITQVSLTRDGQAKLDAARKAAAPVYADLITGISERDFCKFLSMLERFQNNLSKRLGS
jgi:DNA-binding MarR family transcriptional regulator